MEVDMKAGVVPGSMELFPVIQPSLPNGSVSGRAVDSKAPMPHHRQITIPVTAPITVPCGMDYKKSMKREKVDINDSFELYPISITK